MKKILIQGASGFISGHLEARLRAEGHFVVSIARSHPRYRESVANQFILLDLTNPVDFHYHWRLHEFDEAFQFATDGGGLGYIGTGNHDADILTNSVKINLNTLEAMRKVDSHAKIFFASSQCVYPDVGFDPFASERLTDYPVPFKETDASFNTFPFAQEKLFSEQLYAAYARNYGFKISIGRFGNIYGPYATWDGPRAKAPAAICRKVAQAPYAGVVPLWGGGQAVRTYTYVDDAVEGMIRLMASEFNRPVNIASSEEVTTAELFDCICQAAGKILAWEPQHGPEGVRYRGSDNTLCRSVLNWEPMTLLRDGMAQTYQWVAEQAKKNLPKPEA
jgi:GDP-D-mannose 3', 5'-epimerase